MHARQEHAKLALHGNVAHLGVKGPLPLAELLAFDTVEGFPPDYMHAVCLGVTRQVVEILLDSSNH